MSAETGPFYTLLHALYVMLSDLCGGVLNMRDVLSITRTPSFKEFKTFL